MRHGGSCPAGHCAPQVDHHTTHGTLMDGTEAEYDGGGGEGMVMTGGNLFPL